MNHSPALCPICVACNRADTLFFYALYSFLITRFHTKVCQSTIVFSCIMLRISVWFIHQILYMWLCAKHGLLCSIVELLPWSIRLGAQKRVWGGEHQGSRNGQTLFSGTWGGKLLIGLMVDLDCVKYTLSDQKRIFLNNR